MTNNKPIFDVIEYLPPKHIANNWIMYHYPDHEFNSDSKLRINPGQACVVVSSGKIDQLIANTSGTLDLTTANFPVLSNHIKNTVYGGKTVYDIQVYFFNATALNMCKWGTPSPIVVESINENEKGFLFHVMCNGSYYIRLKYFDHFLTWIAGSNKEGTVLMFSDIVGNIRPYVNSVVFQTIADYFDEKKISFTRVQRIASKTVSNDLKGLLLENFKQFGFELNDFVVESARVPDSDQNKYQEMYARRREITSLSGVTDDNALQILERQRQLDALNKAASNEGTAGGMVGAGVGFGLGFQMMSDLKNKESIKETKETSYAICPECGHKNGVDSRFCSNCGHKLFQVVTCPNCKTELEKNAKFCSKCGTKIG